jgi:hypothetical protein
MFLVGRSSLPCHPAGALGNNVIHIDRQQDPLCWEDRRSKCSVSLLGLTVMTYARYSCFGDSSRGLRAEVVQGTGL